MMTAVFRWNKEHAMKHGWPLIAVASLALAGAGSLTVQAQPAADFFKGKTDRPPSTGPIGMLVQDWFRR